MPPRRRGLVKSLRARRAEAQSISMHAETRGAAGADLLVMLGERAPGDAVGSATGAVRIRTLQGMRELFVDPATPKQRALMEQLLGSESDDAVAQDSLDYSSAGSSALMRRIRSHIEREWAQHKKTLQLQQVALERAEQQQQRSLIEAATSGRAHMGLMSQASKWQRDVALEKRRLRAREAEHEAGLGRLLRSLRRLPVIDLVRKDNAEVRTATDELVGREDRTVWHDPRPLAQQFPEMTMAQMERKVLLLELEEGVRPEVAGEEEAAGQRRRASAAAGVGTMRVADRTARVLALSPPRRRWAEGAPLSPPGAGSPRRRARQRPRSAPGARRTRAARYLRDAAGGRTLGVLNVQLPDKDGRLRDFSYDPLFA
eukprot:TRINITY_DN1046_c2_g1_i1.p1 TRINITY_DN1046_c2_g1~~TRINITY_DN1046_c2_g1_i1.p1  ORF type:complete len:400 (+),score=115.93 TRINITY_DN1046_c2_g1_i1:87-1202(+)